MNKFCVLLVVIFLASSDICAQENKQLVRLAKLVIDPDQLHNYMAILKEEIEASVKLEPGVITLYAVSERNPHTSHSNLCR